MSPSPGQKKRTGSRRRHAIGIAIGVAVTAGVLLAATTGLLARFEWTLFDLRARWFDNYTPPPSQDVWHINIDDTALETVGRWPWDRQKLALVVEELERAGASVIAFDVLFDEPQEPRYEPVRQPDGAQDVQRIEDDRVLGRAMEQSDDVLLATMASAVTDTGPVSQRVIDALMAQPYQTVNDVIGALQLSPANAEHVRIAFPSLLQRAIRQRLVDLIYKRGRLPTLTECRRTILASMPAEIQDAPQWRILQDEYANVQALSHVVRFGIEAKEDNDALQLEVPVLPLASATDHFGIVTYESDADGKVRSIPLWVTVQGRQFPHFALAAALKHFDASLDDVEVTENRTTIHNITGVGGHARTVEIPLMHARTGDDWRYGHHRVLISWPTAASDWERLYDPAGRQARQMFPIGVLIEASSHRTDTRHNNQAADAVLATIVNHEMMAGLIDASLVNEYAQLIEQLEGDDLPATERKALADRRHAIRTTVIETGQFILDDFQGLTNLSADEASLRDMLAQRVPQLKLATKEADNGRAVLADYDQRLRQLRDKVCIIGWTATGSIADFVPTSLGERTPGPIVHGAVLNSILTGHFLKRGPLWLDLLAIALTGLFATLVAVRFAPISALVITAGVIVTAFLVNGVMLFDYMNLVVAAAGPTVAAGLAWTAVTVYRLVLEQRERARITKQFKNYVSGDLVDLIVDDPSRIKQGRHELTCMFSDIAGFTTVSEQLGPEQTIALLNEYLRAMTQRIMAGRGTVNKYLGDGIMAFWGAPIDDEEHALHCCQSVLHCIGSMNELQNDERFKDLPRLFMRVGICTGPMMVGDCGAPPDRSDYTVIGDSVNLSARLESSNKQFDTQILLSQRTHELVDDHMLARPIGRIRVVGKAEFETVYELLADRESATADQLDLARMTDGAVSAFIEGRFDDAVARFEKLADRFGRTKLIDLYLDHCRRYLSEGKPDDFRGELVLTQK